MFPEFEEEYENLPEEEIEGTELGLTPLYDFQKREYVLRDGKVVYCSQKQAAAQWVGFLALTMVGKYRVRHLHRKLYRLQRRSIRVQRDQAGTTGEGSTEPRDQIHRRF